ncbi:MAG: fibronectin type III domain-containing protein [Bacteroidota bacterium]
MNTILRIITTLCLLLSVAIGSTQNLISTAGWTAGQGSVTGFTALGDTAENVRALDTDPFNNQSIIWQCITDGGTGFNGGWETSPLSIDPLKTYRFSLWIKKTGTGNGSETFAIKVQNTSGNDISIAELNGTLEGNAIFESTTPPLGEWTLYIGYIHASDYTGTTDIGGLYDGVTGNKLTSSSLQPTDYKFTAESAFVEFRAYLWSSTTIGNVMHTYDPRVYEVNGSEPTIQDLLNGTNPSPDTTPPSAPTGLTSTVHTDTTISLSWNAATDDVGVTGYRVFANGNPITIGNSTSYTLTNLTPDTAYSVTVTALDAAGNESSNSTGITVTTDTASGGGGGTSVWSENGGVAAYSGNVAVGTTTVPTGYHMAIDGKLVTEEVRVELSDNWNWPDYVFVDTYPLRSLEALEKHIKEKGHLPNIPTAKEVEANGIALGEMNRLLLEKIEELTLYILQLKQEINTLTAKN